MNEAIGLVKTLDNRIAIKGNKEMRMVEALTDNWDLAFEQLTPLWQYKVPS